MNEMKTKFFIVPKMIISAALVLSACGSFGTQSPTSVPVGQTQTPPPVPTSTVLPTATEQEFSGTVSLWHGLEASYLPALLRLISTFQTVYPNIYFDVTYIPRIDLRNAYIEAALEGREPSLLIGSGEWGTELYDRGFIAGIGELANNELLATLNTAALEAARYQGQLIGVPWYIDGVVLYRNRSIIPRSPSTLDELIALSMDATQADVFGAFLDRGFYFSAPHLYGLGGTLISESGEPAFNTTEGLEWLDLLSRFEQAGPATNFTDDDRNLFVEGRVGFIIDGTWVRDELLGAVGPSNLVIDSWPVHAGGALAGFIRTENLYLSPRALDERHQVSLMFSEYLLEPESQSELVEVGLIPAISGAPAVIDTLLISVSDPLVAQAMRALADSVPYPHHPNMAVYTSALEAMIRDVLEGGADPAQALESAETSILEVIQATHATATPSP